MRTLSTFLTAFFCFMVNSYALDVLSPAHPSSPVNPGKFRNSNGDSVPRRDLEEILVEKFNVSPKTGINISLLSLSSNARDIYIEIHFCNSQITSINDCPHSINSPLLNPDKVGHSLVDSNLLDLDWRNKPYVARALEFEKPIILLRVFRKKSFRDERLNGVYVQIDDLFKKGRRDIILNRDLNLSVTLQVTNE